MNEFWLWYWRPIAEFLGALLLLGIFVAVLLAWVVFDVYVLNPIKRWRRRRADEAKQTTKSNDAG